MCKLFDKAPMYKLINFISLNCVKSLLKRKRSYEIFSCEKRYYNSERKYLSREIKFMYEM